jgi:hypothetical protein
MRLLKLMLIGAVMAVAVAVPAWGQGNDIRCPAGAVSDAAGTTCFDQNGNVVEPISSNVVFPADGPTCPESSPGNIYVPREDGSGCDLVSGSASASASATPAVAQYEQNSATPDATNPAAPTGVLPATGGPSLLALGAGILLVVGGLLAHRLVR